MPFGVGPRVCAAAVLAWFDLRLIISAIVKNFDMCPAPDAGDIVSRTKEHFVGGRLDDNTNRIRSDSFSSHPRWGQDAILQDLICILQKSDSITS